MPTCNLSCTQRQQTLQIVLAPLPARTINVLCDYVVLPPPSQQGFLNRPGYGHGRWRLGLALVVLAGTVALPVADVLAGPREHPVRIVRLDGPVSAEDPAVVHVLALPLEGDARLVTTVREVVGPQVSLSRTVSRRPDRAAFAARRADPLYLRVLDGMEVGWTVEVVPPLPRTGPVTLSAEPPSGVVPGTRVEIAEQIALAHLLGSTWKFSAEVDPDEAWRFDNASGAWVRVDPEAPASILPGEVFAFVLRQPGRRGLGQIGRIPDGPLRVPFGGELALVAAEAELTGSGESAIAATLLASLDLSAGAELVIHPGVSPVATTGLTESSLLLAPAP